MSVLEIIRKKRDGLKIEKKEIEQLIRGYLAEEVPDYQMAAFLMAAFIRGLDDTETEALTEIMVQSGEVLDLREMADPKVDKHSTGGVGDKVSIVLAPLVAAAGVVVPMIAGRGLGHTGGTIDKLESIPGFNTQLNVLDFRNILWDTGVVIASQSEKIAPADRKLYALRNATSTVESIPLIASSIMSKKIAEGINGLVLDIKVGSGAFIKTEEEAERLARIMIKLGEASGIKTIAVLTDMNEPLGKTVGNAIEIRECINVLKGKAEQDLLDVILTLGAWMLVIGEELLEETEDVGVFNIKEKEITEELINEKRIKLEGLINSGDALEKFIQMVEAQGGNPEIVANPGLLPVAENIRPVEIEKDGFIQRVDAELIGKAAMLLGAGRTRIDDNIDHAAGITLNKKSGSEVHKGDVVAVLHYNDTNSSEEAYRLVKEAFQVTSEPPSERQIVRKVLL